MYRHTGDSGKSQLGNRHFPKSHTLFTIVGQVDLLHSHLGHTIDLIQYDRNAANVVVILLFLLCFLLPYYSVKILGFFLLCLVVYGQTLQSKNQHEVIEKLKRQCAKMIRLGSILSMNGYYNFSSEIDYLDMEIEYLVKNTPPLRAFIYLFGGMPVSQMHIARSVCRQLELMMWIYKEGNDPYRDTVRSEVLVYVNRLSLYLYHLSRYYNYRLHLGDVLVKGSEYA
jgi:ATP:cob(I)alamin adenosyltransferase